jgi:hypothetical protein
MDRKGTVDPHIGQRLKEYRQHRGDDSAQACRRRPRNAGANQPSLQ